MARYLSLYRRRPGVVDLFLTPQANIATYTFQFSTNFNVAFTTFQVVPNTGMKSVSIQDVAFDTNQFRNKVRFTFNPADYTAAFPTLIDGIPLYIRIIATDLDGIAGSAQAMQMVLPYDSGPRPPFVLNGSVPSAVDLGHSLEIQLPHQTQNQFIENTGASVLAIAFDPGGPEYMLDPMTTFQMPLIVVRPTLNQLFLRGVGGAASINAIFAQLNSEV